MKSIGFIDYFLNEWHADNYPAWINAQTNGEMQVKYAYGHIQPGSGLMTNEQWAEKNGVELCATIDEVIEKSDYIVVLSPDNPEMHVELSKKALESGKPVYVDKTFSQDKADAETIFAIAEAHNTPCFSSSALRFSQKLQATKGDDVTCIVSTAGGPIKNYIIHQIEPICVLMGTDVDKAMFTGNMECPTWLLHFADGRTADFRLMKGEITFSLKINHAETTEQLNIDDDFFQDFIAAMLHFFRTGDIPVSHQDTVNIMAIREACLKSIDIPCEWVAV